MQTIGIFCRVDGFQNLIGVYVVRKWQLHDVAGAFWVVVELVDDFQNFVLGGGFWQFAVQ